MSKPIVKAVLEADQFWTPEKRLDYIEAIADHLVKFAAVWSTAACAGALEYIKLLAGGDPKTLEVNRESIMKLVESVGASR